MIRIMVPRLSHHDYLQRVTSHILKVPVHINHVETGWYGFQPSISLDDIDILNKKTGKSELKVQHIILQVNLFSSLLHWQLLPSRLTIDGAKLNISKDKQGHYFIGGLHPHAGHHTSTKMRSVMLWLLTQSDVTLKNINLNYLGQAQLSPINVRIHNDFFEHHIFGSFSLAGHVNTRFTVISDLDDGDETLKDLNGNIYFSVKNFSDETLGILKKNFPQLSKLPIHSFNGGIKAWMGISKGHINNVLTYYALRNLTYTNISLKNMLGKVEWNFLDGKNEIYLDNKQGSIGLSQFYTHPINVGSLAMDAVVIKGPKDWDVKINRFNLANKNLYVTAKLHLTKHLKQKPIVDFMAGFSVADLSKVSDYLPTKIMKKHLLDWFSQAFIGGQVDHGTVIYRGPLQKMQMHDKRMHFEVAAKLHNLVMSYTPHWPLARNGEVNLDIRNKVLHATSQHVESMNNFVDSLALTIPFEKHSSLDLTLHSIADAHNGWEYVENSPMHLAQALKRLNFSGPLDFNLKLHVPLHNKPHNDVVAQGVIRANGASLSMPQWNLKFNDILGVLKFNNKNLNDNGKGMQALLFGNPINIRVNTKFDKKNISTLHFDSVGSLSTDNIASHFPLPLAQFFSGRSLFAADLAIHDSKNLGNDLHISTDLVGVKSHDLPVPFAKTANQKRDLKLDITMRDNKPLYLRVGYANLASSALIYDKAIDGLKFRSGNIQLGGERAQYLAQPGLVINGHLPQLDWSQWQIFLDRLLKVQQTEKNHHVITVRSLSLDVDKLLAYNNTFNNIKLALRPLKNAWKVNFINKLLDGYVIIPQNHNNKWVFNFKKLYINKLSGHNNNSQLSPLTLPPFQVDIKDLHYAGHPYGSVHVLAQHLNNGLLIKNINVNSKSDSLKANGWWKQKGDLQQSYMAGVLSTQNLGKLLSGSKKKIILGGEGNVKFSLNADSSPLKLHWNKLSGKVSFLFTNGSLVAVDKKSEAEIGIGRVLNILSVDSLLSRIKSHFKDLTQRGLWFDSFTGNLDLEKGIASTTKNAYLKGPLVEIQAWGALDLAHESSHMHLYVVPQLTSSLPTVVGIFGGPIAGVAAWVANKLVGPEINRISASTYSVTGPWKHLKIAKTKSK
jgi:uncharacterized protein (TIGR02099 family)